MLHFDLEHCHSFWRSFAYIIEIDGSEHSVFCQFCGGRMSSMKPILVSI